MIIAPDDANKRARTDTSSLTAQSSAKAQEPLPATSEVLSPLPLDVLDGELDGYSTELKFLHTKYQALGSTTLDFPTLYAEIIRRQGLGQKTFGFKIGRLGELICPEIAEPMGDEPLTPLTITGSCEKLVKFESKEWRFKPSMAPGPGYMGKIEWESDGCGYASPKSGKGYIKMRKAWENERGNALYEGFWEVKVIYDGVLRRKGHGSGRDYRGSFWAVAKPAKDSSEADEAGKENEGDK